MNFLSNAFSLLEVDADDDQLNNAPSSSSKRKNKKKVNGPNVMEKKEKQNGKNLVISSSEECKMPLVWIDLEMTGLNTEVDRILEIACIITDGNLTKSVEGPDLVIHQSKECLDQMGEWCQIHHAASGLTNKVLQSKVTEKEAEKQVIEFVKKHVGTYTPLIAGNSVYVDFQFLKKYMPDLAGLFSHVVVDVSSVKALCMRWYPQEITRHHCCKSMRVPCTPCFLGYVFEAQIPRIFLGLYLDSRKLGGVPNSKNLPLPTFSLMEGVPSPPFKTEREEKIRGKLLTRKINIEPWMISEKA